MYHRAEQSLGAQAGGVDIDVESLVSMNMWGVPVKYMDMLEKDFTVFLDGIAGNELKGEYLLSIHIGGLLEKGEIAVKVLQTNDKWFGVTYKEDKDFVIESFKKLIAEGVYSENLFSDLNK